MIAAVVVAAWFAPTPAQVLADVQTHYAKAKALSADFEQVVTNATFGTTDKPGGTIVAERPAKLHWEYVKRGKVTKTFLSDGTNLYAIEPIVPQVSIAPISQSAMPAVVSFLVGGNLAAQFTPSFDTSGTYGGTGATVLALAPKQASAAAQKMFFVVDPKSHEVAESIVIDASGNSNHYIFKNQNLAAVPPPDAFVFKPSMCPNCRVVRFAPKP